jgi:hypothetical protein
LQDGANSVAIGADRRSDLHGCITHRLSKPAHPILRRQG